jgi:AraC-like DNA-binding protein
MLIDDGTRRRLCRARELLEDVSHEPLSIRDVAREVGISRAHFIMLFDATFGTTPHQHRIAIRLDSAKQLLARGELSITEVCMAVGFSSLGSFSALFARRLGETPSEYARRARVLVQVPNRCAHALMPGCLSLMGHLPAHAFRTFQEA